MEFPSGLAVRIWCHCCSVGSIPGPGTPTCCGPGQRGGGGREREGNSPARTNLTLWPPVDVLEPEFEAWRWHWGAEPDRDGLGGSQVDLAPSLWKWGQSPSCNLGPSPTDPMRDKLVVRTEPAKQGQPLALGRGVTRHGSVLGPQRRWTAEAVRMQNESLIRGVPIVHVHGDRGPGGIPGTHGEASWGWREPRGARVGGRGPSHLSLA